MVVGRKVVANVVDQCAQNIFIVAAVALGECRSLQAMFKSVDRKATVVVAQVFELFDDSVGHVRLCDLKLDHDVVPILFCRFTKRFERGTLIRCVNSHDPRLCRFS